MSIQRIVEVTKAKKAGDGYLGLCPAHEDHDPSLAIKDSNRGPLVHCHAGCSQEAVIEALRALDAWPEKGSSRGNGGSVIVAEYPYENEDGSLAYTIYRTADKQFLLKGPDGKWGLQGAQKVLYRSPKVIKSKHVLVVEGEKDVQTAEKLGFVATTFPFGTGGWDARYAKHFQGKRVAVIPDNDKPGIEHANDICRGLKGVAEMVKLVPLPGVPKKGDLSDWVVGKEKAHKELRKLIADAPEWSDPGPAGIVCLSDVEAEEVHWLWKPYIPIGKVTLIEGDPGRTKSWLSLAIGTSITLGRGLPGVNPCPPGNILLLSAEDGVGDTIKPRCEALGTDCDRVWALTDPLVLDKSGFEQLKDCAKRYQPRAIFIDPLFAYFPRDRDINKANEVRSIMTRLARFAEESSCAIVCIRHLTKSSKSKDIYRGIGSIDLTAACRSVLLVGCDSNDPEKRALVHIKSNLAKLGDPIGYEIREGKFYWTGPSDITAADILAPDAGDQDKSALQEAEEFLLELLADHAVPANEVYRQAESLEIAKSTLLRAKQRLKIQSKKRGFTDGRWRWSLPEGTQDPTVRSGSENLRAKKDCKYKKNKELVEDTHDENLRENLRGNSENLRGLRRFEDTHDSHPKEDENLHENLRDDDWGVFEA